jgi:hypothetical protein
VSSAEAGTELAISDLQQATSLGALPCVLTGSLGTGPTTASYTTTLKYYDSSNNLLTCTGSYYAGSTSPARAEIISKGTTNSAAYGNQGIDALVQLTPVVSLGNIGNDAAFSNGNETSQNKVTINGYGGSNADVYVNGDMACDNTSTIHGSVYVHGSLTTQNVCNTDGSWWASGNVTDSSGSTIGGNVTSSGGSISLHGTSGAAGSTQVAGYAKAAGTNTGGTVSGQRLANQTGLLPPPTQTFPQLSYVASNWTAAGWSVKEEGTNCTQAVSDMAAMATATQKTVIHVGTPAGGAACQLYWSSSTTLTLNQPLVVFADGGFKWQNTLTLNTTGSAENLYLIVPWTNSLGNQTVCTNGQPWIYFQNTVTASSNVTTLLYSPCDVYVQNSLGYGGQVYGGDIHFQNSISFDYVPATIPGFGTSSSLYNVSLAYERQVVPS